MGFGMFTNTIHNKTAGHKHIVREHMQFTIQNQVLKRIPSITENNKLWLTNIPHTRDTIHKITNITN
jgi:hypothetical protein